ncbi:hypothetical protein BJV82DRAFT_663446 [Fennellomyces sp. T-0311]|nr:hypothetical protein BJV82DRAFT_663446 [Fennellomyces sp. T-0311]
MPVDLDAPMDDFDAPSDDKSKQTSVSDESTNDEDDSDLVVSDKEDPSDLDEPSLKTAYLCKKEPEQTKSGKSTLKEVDTGKRKRSSIINSDIGRSGEKTATGWYPDESAKTKHLVTLEQNNSNLLKTLQVSGDKIYEMVEIRRFAEL